MLVRDDQGGLGNLTYRAWCELRPEVTVVVQWRPCRGVPDPERFRAPWTETVLTDRPIPDGSYREWAGMADVWWTAESWYSDNAEAILRDAGCRTVLYAMPELFGGSQADEVWNPTTYLAERRRLGDVMPWPLSPPERWLERHQFRRILHVSGGATGDRNGTQAFVAALGKMTAEVEVGLHQPEPRHRVDPKVLRRLPRNVTVRQTVKYVPDLAAALEWADLLVLPRRYAGLCLPALEAFERGCPVLMTDVHPQAEWPILRVPAVRAGDIKLRGGRVPLWDVDPTTLAGVLDNLAGWGESRVVAQSRKVRWWAEARSWEQRRDEWEVRLGR